MSLADLDLLVPPPGTGDSEAAFVSVFAMAIGTLHREMAGAAGDTAMVIESARSACVAVQRGHAWADITADGPAGITIDIDAIRRSPAIGDGRTATPLVLVGSRLYLHRYWQYERQLSDALTAMNRPVIGLDWDAARAIVRKLFPGMGSSKGAATIDWQKIVVASALSRHLCIVSGGPGTGKTSTVVRILLALLSLEPNLRMAIAAPTGKAAARLKASILSQAANLGMDDALRGHLPTEAFTLHRLLGYQPNRTAFRYDAHRKLPYQVVVVDEASMLDLAMAAKLVAALPSEARLILLGDKDQLASVEAGAVYAELSSRWTFDREGAATLEDIAEVGGLPISTGEAPLANAVTWLRHNWRFSGGGAISQLAETIIAGHVPMVREVISSGSEGLAWCDALPAPLALAEELAAGFDPYVNAVRSGAPPSEVLRCFDLYRVLCSTRAGPYGSEALNRLLSLQMHRRLGIRSSHARWFEGRAVMVVGNDYALRLFNGDTGIALTDQDGHLSVFFAGDNGVRALAPGRLAQVETGFALTVHKSQGSEFDSVDVIVDGALARGLNRQLFYTAVTRARSRVRVWCSDGTLDALVTQTLERRSSILTAAGAGV